MSLLFADIYDGIRAIRITKGVSEKDILNFVQEKVGGCMNVGNVLKTIRTLKKLCEDGVLMKKGKRYMFTPKNCRKEEEEEEDEEEDDECQEEIQPQVADSCDECDDGAEEKQEEQEEEEEEDDDDEEEDDDDDDDDDEECDDKDVQAVGEEGSGKKENTMEMNKNPIRSKESLLQGGPSSKSPTGNGSSESGSGTPNCLDKKVNRGMTGDSVKKAGSDKGRKTSKGKSMVEQDGDATARGNEAIAFCVRDFIDSLSQPDSEALEFGREISLKKRGLRNKRNAGRSRSPVKEGQAELYHCFGKGPSDEIGFRAICSDLFQDPADVEMEVDQKKEEEVTTIHRNLPTHSGEPCGDPEKMQSVLAERSYEDFRESLAKKASMILPVQNNECALGQMTWYPLEEREKETETANRSSSEEGNGKEKTVSLCSVCEKKKRNL